MCDSKKDQNLTRVAKSGAIWSSNFLDFPTIFFFWNETIQSHNKIKQSLFVSEYNIFLVASRKDAKVRSPFSLWTFSQNGHMLSLACTQNCVNGTVSWGCCTQVCTLSLFDSYDYSDFTLCSNLFLRNKGGRDQILSDPRITQKHNQNENLRQTPEIRSVVT